ncbi:hypothetical protein ABZX85_46040 [Streptomyces sp. NPDC004539]|uniref:hypothetical protein n=1 Tax=Streptomyces sp. NPDC004539 TaxID=3154280 RepID=UPI0033BDDF04
MIERIQEAVQARDAGKLGELWEEIGVDGDAFHRCVLAHHMADLQDDPHDELAWDLRALEAAGQVGDERVKEHHPALAVRGFYPSLHLNLAASYQRTGDKERARSHVAQAQGYLDALAPDAYGDMIREALGRLAGELGE